MFYALYNHANKSYLKHAYVGIWFSDDLAEAEKMRSTCQMYMKSNHVDYLFDFIEIVPVGDELVQAEATSPHR